MAWLALLLLTTLATAAPPDVERLSERDPASLLEVVKGSIALADADGQPVWRWRINAGQSSELSLRPAHEVFDRLRHYDRLRLEFRIVSGEIEALGLRALTLIAGPASAASPSAR